MKITAFKAFMQRSDNRPRVLLKVETDEGIFGWGEAYNHGPDYAVLPMLDFMFEQVKGIDPRRIEFVLLKLYQHARFPMGAIGLAALSAIDHALWDILGKSVGLPVYMLLGGNVRDRVRVYHGLHDIPTPEACRDKCQELNEKYGYTAFKMSPFQTEQHFHRWGIVCKTIGDYFGRVRELLPAEWEFAFDAHARIFEPYEAVQMAQALAPNEPMFLEEPLRPENVEAWGRLKRQITVPLATGECLYSRYEFLNLLNAEGVDIIQPDICAVGGISEMRKIATLADAHFVTVAPHNPMGPLATAVNVHFCAAHPGFKILESKVADEARWMVDPYLPKDGYMELRPDRPGLGVEIDEKVLEKDDYVRWDRKLPAKPDGSLGWP